MQISGKEIIDAFSSDELLHFAIIKLIREKGDWREVARNFPRLCWEIQNALNDEMEEEQT